MHREFESERLLLKPTLEVDSKLIYQVMNTPKFIKYVGDRGMNSLDDAKKYIQIKMLPQLHTLGYSSYSLITKADGSKIGTCGLYNRDGINGIDIGFGLLPQFEGLGYGYESACRLIKAAFEVFEIEKIKAITAKENFSSQRLLEKLGLQMVGTIKLPNENEDIFLYEIEKPSWLKNGLN